MQAQTKRHIQPGYRYDALLPKSMGADVVIVGPGKARLKDTLNLMKAILKETTADTALLATKLKGNNVLATCRNIWDFVYHHIQYKMDATGIEQVRRPSRTWADRSTGVDCDCYTVFIGSILTNLGIPFVIRITKYGGKKHFQHVYPVVVGSGKPIPIDCVADRFNYEVPYSEKKDIAVDGPVILQDISGLSGVDTVAIPLDALQQKRIPLHQIQYTSFPSACIPVKSVAVQPHKASAKSAKLLSPYRLEDQRTHETLSSKKEWNWLHLAILSGISVAAGIGILKLLGKSITDTPKGHNTNTIRKTKK